MRLSNRDDACINRAAARFAKNEYDGGLDELTHALNFAKIPGRF
jgi:hypothetical protein